MGAEPHFPSIRFPWPTDPLPSPSQQKAGLGRAVMDSPSQIHANSHGAPLPCADFLQMGKGKGRRQCPPPSHTDVSQSPAKPEAKLPVLQVTIFPILTGQSEGTPALHHIREEKQLLSPISSAVLVEQHTIALEPGHIQGH